jgi:hypothetical protein
VALWLPGRELLRISASTSATREQEASSVEATTRSGMTETSSAPEPAKFLRKQRFDELVQWMVQDASPGRCDR